MRSKLAKALRREANTFATDTGRLQNRTRTTTYKRKEMQIVRMEALKPDGSFDDRKVEVEVIHETLRYIDGPRFFYLQLKKAYRARMLDA